jgi:hypothetical protein
MKNDMSEIPNIKKYKIYGDSLYLEISSDAAMPLLEFLCVVTNYYLENYINYINSGN